MTIAERFDSIKKREQFLSAKSCDTCFLITLVETYRNVMRKVCPMNEDHAEQVEYEFHRLTSHAEGKGEGKK